MWRKRTRLRRIRQLRDDHSYVIVLPSAVMRESKLEKGMDLLVFSDPDNPDRVILQKPPAVE